MRVVQFVLRRGRCVTGALAFAAVLAGCATQGTNVAPDSVAVDARANGIAVRAKDGAVLITDDRTNSVLISTDRLHYGRFASVTAVSGQPNSLGQLVFAEPDILFVARFGFGANGAILEIGPDGAVSVLSGPDPARRRLGLASLSANRLLSTWFVKGNAQSQQGGVSLIVYDSQTHTATERDLLTGLGKPVGVAVSRGQVFVTDQASNQIVEANLDTLLAAQSPQKPDTVLAKIDSPDLLAVNQDGALFTKCGEHGLCKITADGSVTQLSTDFSDARGVAPDQATARLYAVDRAKAASDTSAVRAIRLP